MAFEVFGNIVCHSLDTLLARRGMLAVQAPGSVILSLIVVRVVLCDGRSRLGNHIDAVILRKTCDSLCPKTRHESDRHLETVQGSATSVAQSNPLS